jgi:hypothetical protein
MVMARLHLEVARRRGVPGFPFCGEVEHDACAMCAASSRAGGGPLRERSLYGELFGCSVHNTRGGFVWEGALVGVHYDPIAGDD